jgi:integrase
MRGSVYKRGRTWTWQFTTGTYRAGNRQTISHGGYATKKAASLDLADALARFGKGDRRVLVKASTLTLGEYLEEWLEIQRRVRKPSTAGGYENIVRAWVRSQPIGQVALADLDWRVFVKLYDDLRAHGGRPTKAARVKAAATGTKPVGSPLGPRTIQSVHVLLRSALGHAVERELLQVNPTDRIPKALRPTHKPTLAEGKCWEPEQARRFLEATRGGRWHALWALGLDTGARRGELLAVRWSDIDWDAPKVRITKNRVVVKGEVIEGTPKSKRSVRDVGIAMAVPALQEWRRRQLAETGRSQFVFTDELGEPVRPDRVNEVFRQACKAAGVPNIGPHGMRHTAATLMLAGLKDAAGNWVVSPEPLHVVSARLGHADTSVTASLYAHVLKDQETGAAQGLAAIYGAGGS